jgi:copper oxidase (laccase) domain-containing protein
LNQDFELKELGQIKHFNCRELDNTNLVVNAFTARTGGVSRTPFNNLNLSYNVGDEESRVAENRKIILDALSIDYRTTVTAQQVHKDKIALVRKEDKGKGAFKYSKGIAQTDALITDIPGIPLLMCYADCVPIFILKSLRPIPAPAWLPFFPPLVPAVITSKRKIKLMIIG